MGLHKRPAPARRGRANQASRRVALAKLERSGGFRLKFAPGTRLEERVTLDIVDASLEEVLGNLLGDASEESDAARDALLRALNDPDPQVVIAALDSLEWIGDASMVPHITPLLQHPNAEVRAAAEAAISFLGG